MYTQTNPYWGGDIDFAEWFAGSVLVENGEPIPLYHGTDKKDSFYELALSSRWGQPVISFAFNREEAEGYANYESGFVEEQALEMFPERRVYKAFLHVENPFDYRVKKDVRELLPLLRADIKKMRIGGRKLGKRAFENEFERRKEAIELGKFEYLERPDLLIPLGYDAVYSVEDYEEGNIHVFSPEQVWVACIEWYDGRVEGACGVPV